VADNSTGDAAAFIILSILLVLAGFAMSMATGGPFGMAAFFLSLAGASNLAFWTGALAIPTLWVGLLALGLHWYGRAALWLLLAAPFAFYHLPFLFLMRLGKG
jgi:hypothetical protein